MSRSKSKGKEPGLLRQIIAIRHEQAKRRRALRILNRQEWSVEFMEYLVEHAARVLGKDIVIEVESPAGHKLRISSVADSRGDMMADDDIFNHLDDQAAVEAFIRDHRVR